MENLLKYMKRRQNRRSIACYVFLAAIGILYITNFTMDAFVYHADALDFLVDFVLPMLAVIGIYVMEARSHFLSRLLYTHIPKVKLLAVCAPVVAVLISCLVYSPYADAVDFTITVLAIAAMCIAPYALRNIQHACLAITVEALGFVVIAANLGNNSAAMVTIAVAALVLIFCLPKLDWLMGKEDHLYAKATVAAVTLISGLGLLFLTEGSGVAKAFLTSAAGRPGLGSSAFVNQQCANLLTRANFVGAAPLEGAADGLFANRVLSCLLAQGGWLAVLPVLLALVLLITSGIYLCCRNNDTHYYVQVSSLTVMAVQAVGYILMCAGWDKLLFPEFCPLLDGGLCVNTLFLLMAVCILPPRRDPMANSVAVNSLEKAHTN